MCKFYLYLLPFHVLFFDFRCFFSVCTFFATLLFIFRPIKQVLCHLRMSMFIHSVHTDTGTEYRRSFTHSQDYLRLSLAYSSSSSSSKLKNASTFFALFPNYSFARARCMCVPGLSAILFFIRFPYTFVSFSFIYCLNLLNV